MLPPRQAEARTTTVHYDVESSTAVAAAQATPATTFTVAYSLYPAASTSANGSKQQLPLLVLSHPFNNARAYWSPQAKDAQLNDFTLVVLDAIGFGESATQGRPWSFDLAAHSILVILDELERKGLGKTAVVVGDSMGGGPTGLRTALQDTKRVKERGGSPRIVGVVAAGTAAEEESTDFVEEYTQGAIDFGKQCVDPSAGVEQAIKTLAHNMCQDGYTSSNEEPYASSRAHGETVIQASLRLALRNEQGELDPVTAGLIMLNNFNTLNYRKGLIPHLASRPSRLGQAQVLVIHGTEEKAYPFDRNYHERTVSAIGPDRAELYVVQGGPHFVTASHWEEVDRVVVDWIRRRCLGN